MQIMGIPVMVVGVVVLALLSVGGVLYAVMYSAIEAEQKKNRRLAGIKAQKTDSKSKRAAHDKIADAQKRRKNIADSLTEIEERNKERDAKQKKPSLKLQLAQSGLKLDVRRFYMYSAGLGLAMSVVALILGVPIYVVPGVLFAAGFGLPRWILNFIRKRRCKKFLEEFPNAIDIIVRAIKSGLPLNDGLRLIASEARDPVKTEFQRIIERQQLGMSTPEACLKMPETMPLQEASFFAIVIQIQAQAGGNLSEALGNLSKVLRARKQMRAKVSAMSMEAKASAAIIASLPFIVSFLVYLSSPDYITLLFTDEKGYMILGVSAIWMSIGVFVMRQMVNFEV